MIIRCTYSDVLPLKELKAKFHPKNRNKHPDDQIERLAQILKYQGVRVPAKISKRSGFLTAGHGRVLAAIKNGWDQFPVDYQDYENEDMEYADLVADNSVALWAELDLAGINADIGELGPDFDIDLLGIKDFVLDLGAEHALDEKPEKEAKESGVHILEVHLPTEEDMIAVYEDLLSRGFIVKYR